MNYEHGQQFGAESSSSEEFMICSSIILVNFLGPKTITLRLIYHLSWMLKNIITIINFRLTQNFFQSFG